MDGRGPTLLPSCHTMTPHHALIRMSNFRFFCFSLRKETNTVLKSQTFSVVNAWVLRGHWRRLRKFLTNFLSLTKDVFGLCHKLQLLMTNGFVILVTFYLLPVIDADNFGIYSTRSGVNCGKIWYFSTLSRVNCGQYGYFWHLGKINTIQGSYPWPRASLLAAPPTAPPIYCQLCNV